MTTMKKIIWEEDCDGPKEKKLKKLLIFLIHKLYKDKIFLVEKQNETK